MDKMEIKIWVTINSLEGAKPKGPVGLPKQRVGWKKTLSPQSDNVFFILFFYRVF